MSNKPLAFVKVGTDRKVRIECLTDHVRSTRNGYRITVESDKADVYMEVDGVEVTLKTQPGSVDLETARKALANAIEAAKKTFEHDTGTTLTTITPEIMSHLSTGKVDGSVLMSVGVTAVYPSGETKGATWSAS